MKLFLFVFIFIFISAAQTAEPVKNPKPAPAGEKPEEVAHTYIRGLADLHLNVVADAMHPRALDGFHKILAGMADAIAAAPAERRPPERVVNALFGDAGPAALKTATPREAFVRFMSNLTTFVPQIREMTAGSEYQVLGHVEEGDLAHVVFRATLRRGDTAMTKMEVLTLQRDGAAWKILLTDDLADLVSGLGRQLTAPPPSAPSAPSAPNPAK